MRERVTSRSKCGVEGEVVEFGCDGGYRVGGQIGIFSSLFHPLHGAVAGRRGKGRKGYFWDFVKESVFWNIHDVICGDCDDRSFLALLRLRR